MSNSRIALQSCATSTRPSAWHQPNQIGSRPEPRAYRDPRSNARVPHDIKLTYHLVLGSRSCDLLVIQGKILDMANMAGQNMAQEEVWDDSALVNSWNEAFEEYKVRTRVSMFIIHVLIQAQKYHSLAAKGEKVDLTAERAAKSLLNGDAPPGFVIQSSVADQQTQPTSNDLSGDTTAGDETPAGAQPTVAPLSVPTAAAIPQALMATGMVHSRSAWVC